MYDRDVIIVGGGPAGYAASIRASQLGGKVLLVEQDKIGGTCLHRGCIPSKVLSNYAFLQEKVSSAVNEGILEKEPGVNLKGVRLKQEETVSRLYSGLQHVLKKNDVDIVAGTAEVNKPGEVIVYGRDKRKKVLAARNIILAAGSSERPLAINSSLQIKYSEEGLTPPFSSCRVVIIGGGSTGLEIASAYTSLGFEVSVVEKENTLLPALEDDEINKWLAFYFKKRGIDVYTNSVVSSARKKNDRAELILNTPRGEETLGAEIIIASVGRAPNTHFINTNLKHKIVFSKKVAVNEKQQSAVEGIFAAGDITGPPMLAHLSFVEGFVAAENALGGNKTADTKNIPYFVSTVPAIAWVGITEKQAKAAGITYKTNRFPFTANAHSIITGGEEGMVKVITRENDGVILGMQILGEKAAELIMEGVWALEHGFSTGSMGEIIHPHPGAAEAVWEAFLGAAGYSLHG